jgi:ferric-dicitrate binding protein FerR (iron transport regulator)
MKIEDLLRDPSFCNWANDTNPGHCKQWERHLDAHPEDAEMLLAAKFMASRQPFELDKPDYEEAEQAWTTTETAIQSRSESLVRRKRWIYTAAAAMIALLITAGFMLASQQSPVPIVSLSTQPGEIAEFNLPDGSTVTLNGNSTISYPDLFAGNASREVHVKGEVYLEVVHLESDGAFTVVTPEGRTTVLGTSFNVKSRGATSTISLLEGAVKIANTDGTDVHLTPGQTATLSQSSITVIEDDVDSRASWRNRLWVFNKTPLHEILQNLEESFGITASVDPDVNLDKSISGKLSTKNLSTLYTALETMLAVRISGTDQRIVIKHKPE